jgi:SHS2 domain-containing protein
MYKYKYLDHTADIAINVTADTVDEVFICFAIAFRDTLSHGSSKEMIEDELDISCHTLEELLVYFLNELNYFLTVKKKLFSKVVKLDIIHDKEFRLKSRLAFEHYNPSLHHLKVEIKAITFHNLKIEQVNNRYNAVIVFDI